MLETIFHLSEAPLKMPSPDAYAWHTHRDGDPSRNRLGKILAGTLKLCSVV